MNYYPFHLGDYVSHTRHLSLLEDLAYRRMLDMYYITEEPLLLEPERVARLIGMREHVREVSDVLDEFFEKTDDGYVNKRCDKELAIYQAKADRAKSANKARWGASRAAAHGADDDMEFDSKPGQGARTPSAKNLTSDMISDQVSVRTQIATNNHKPVTNNHQPVTITHHNHQPVPVGSERRKPTSAAPTYTSVFELAWQSYPECTGRNKRAAYREWNARLSEGISAETMIASVNRYRTYVKENYFETRYVKHPSTFFSDEDYFTCDWGDPAYSTARQSGAVRSEKKIDYHQGINEDGSF